MALIGAALSACGEKSLPMTAPPPAFTTTARVDGTWIWSGPGFGFSSIQMLLYQTTDSIVTGYWVARTADCTASGTSPCDEVGYVEPASTRAGSQLHLLLSGQHPLSLIFNGQLTSDTTMSGSSLYTNNGTKAPLFTMTFHRAE